MKKILRIGLPVLYEEYVGVLPQNLLETTKTTGNETDNIKQDGTEYRTILRGEEFEFEPGTYIPEPNVDNNLEEGIKWEPRLGCYILDNIYYDEVNQYFYMVD